MRKTLFYVLPVFLFLLSCNYNEKPESTMKKESAMSENPLLQKFDTPFGVPPYDKIKPEHYLPALKVAIEEHNKEIEQIINNPEEPTFENTIVAFARSGRLYDMVTSIFYTVNEANTSDEMEKIAEEMAPLTSRHEDDILLNEKLFDRIKAVYQKKDELTLDTEDSALLEKVYKKFARNGANLNEEDKAKLRKINEELSLLTLKFGQHVLAETNRFKLVVDNKDDLEGLPEDMITTAAQKAKDAGLEGKWIFTIDRPTLYPFLTYAKNRELRKKLFEGYIMKGDHNDSLDNKDIVNRIVNLRIEKANLLGYKTWADFRLDDNMAKTPDNVYKLMDQIWTPALKVAKEEAAELQKMINKEGGNFELKPWDWWYYAEKVRKEKYDLNEDELKPYFALDNVIHGIFYTANRLYGLTFEERKDLPVYHPDVKAFLVKYENGDTVGILYMDFYTRASKRGGAWMEAIRKEYRDENGKRVPPVIYIVTNFAPPAGGKPSLLTLENVTTLFHEFGHALHGLLSQCTYRMISGTSVYRDFVELPSQFMENFATEPEVLKEYAKHYETGEVMPEELMKKIDNSKYFNQGFATVEYLSAAYLDMDWHTLTEEKDYDVNAFEKAALDKIGLIPQIVVRYRSTYFNHIFSGDYSAGYYSYIWADVLVADAYAYFKEKGIFNPEVTTAFRTNILEKGGTEDPMVLYKKFRGQEPDVKWLLKARGLMK